MVKKISNQVSMASPKKDMIMSNIDQLMNAFSVNNINMNNMKPNSNGGKKTKSQQKNGSNKTSGDAQVEEERENVQVNSFDVPVMSEQMQEEIKRQMSQRGISQHSMDEPEVIKEKNMKKDNAYLKFFKFYYDKTISQHPNWTPSQITTIISLLWKKKKVQDKMGSQKPMTTTSRRTNRQLTGKQAFKAEHKNLGKEQIDEMWTKLPNESKNFWKKEGEKNYQPTQSKLSEVSSVHNCVTSIRITNQPMRLLLNYI